MAIKLIALDLDGTTLNNDRVISERNRNALQQAAEKGVSSNTAETVERNFLEPEFLPAFRRRRPD